MPGLEPPRLPRHPDRPLAVGLHGDHRVVREGDGLHS